MSEELVTLVKELIESINRLEKSHTESTKELMEKISDIKQILNKAKIPCCTICGCHRLSPPSECDICGKTYCHNCLFFGHRYENSIICLDCGRGDRT
jgi:hypothetical protein